MENYDDMQIQIPESLQSKGLSSSSVLRASSSCEFCEECEDPCEWEEHSCGWDEMPCDWCEVTGECSGCQFCEDCESSSESTPTTVTCTKEVYYNNTYQYSENEGNLTPGYGFTPSAHMPSYDYTNYQLVSIKYGSTDVTSGSITCPSSNFTLRYYFSASLEKWSWYASNGSATAAQTRQAYQAITSQGNLSDFSYLVWNDLCEKVKEVRQFCTMSWNNAYATFAETKMSSWDKEMTAARCNSLRYNVNEALSLVSRGDTIYGYYFTEIADSINAWIDYIMG